MEFLQLPPENLRPYFRTWIVQRSFAGSLGYGHRTEELGTFHKGFQNFRMTFSNSQLENSHRCILSYPRSLIDLCIEVMRDCHKSFRDFCSKFSALSTFHVSKGLSEILKHLPYFFFLWNSYRGFHLQIIPKGHETSHSSWQAGHRRT